VRLSEILESEVVDAEGRHLGKVHDVVLVADGRVLDVWGPALRLHELVVGRRSIGARLGLTEDGVRGPWMLKALFGRQRRDNVAWSRVASVADGVVRLRPPPG
jgi:hypothetical protein